MHERAANDPPNTATETTLWDLVVALQDAADEASDSQEEADALVFASLVEMRHRFNPVEGVEVVEKKAA